MHLDEYTNAFAHGLQERGRSSKVIDRSWMRSWRSPTLTGGMPHVDETEDDRCVDAPARGRRPRVPPYRRLNADGDGLVTTQTCTRSTIAMSTTTPTESGSWLLGPTTD
jgi:hypothetical protein